MERSEKTSSFHARAQHCHSAERLGPNPNPNPNPNQVVLYADRAFAKDDQVLVSYGQKSNAELLLLYGFVVDRNLFDEVELAPPLPQPSL